MVACRLARSLLHCIESDQPDEFYLDQVREACLRAGLGAVTRVRGKAVWSMAPYLGRDNAREMESLQGDSCIFHCSDYMFPSSMSHAMCYAARLAKRTATTLGFYEEPPALWLGSRSRNLVQGLWEWAAFEASVRKDRKCLKMYLHDEDSMDASETTSEEQQACK